MARLLTHPHIDDVTVAGILHALADPTRLGIVNKLLKNPAGMNCREMTLKLDLSMPKSTCSQHYRILREAGLIASERRGVDLSSRVRAAELEARFPGLLASILKSFAKETSRAARGRELVRGKSLAR
ncbi:MAG TPA: ArsR family transcriptional regulator [Steroidobacteraceae bacterium]|nr:ArsR family transcriptional regulator [Steroidobacteraceae bacterium]